MRLPERLGLWRCRRGHHAPLEWRKATPADAQRIAGQGDASEIAFAAGLLALAQWNGWRPRCGRAVEWSTHRPDATTKRKRKAARNLATCVGGPTDTGRTP